MRAAQPRRRKLWRICPRPFPIGSSSSTRSLLFAIKIDAILPEISYRSYWFVNMQKKKTMTDSDISRLVSAKPRGSLETVIEEEEERWLTERTWLERTDERRNDRLFLTRRVRSTVCAREQDSECRKLRWCQWTRPCEESAGASSSAIPTISGSCLSHGTETNFVTLRKRRDTPASRWCRVRWISRAIFPGFFYFVRLYLATRYIIAYIIVLINMPNIINVRYYFDCN